MKKRLYNHIRTLLLPCLLFSVLAGFLSAILITAFKIAVEHVIRLSNLLYGAVKENPIWLPLLICGAAMLGLAASHILSRSHSCRGGGIPTSVTAIRGIVQFRWIASILLLPFSALITFFCGLPLGTEGPCVQMGTAVGEGVIKCFGSEKYKGWERYIMTGGASAGFSIATASPVAAIIFSMEELHKRFSPLLLTVASISVISAQITSQILASLGIGSIGLFHIATLPLIPTKSLFVPLVLGLICGACSIFFSYLYQWIDKFMRSVLKKVSVKIAFPLLFACVSIIGFFLSDTLGTGHALTEHLFSAHTVWYLLILVFLIRMVIMMVSNTSGITGGVFLPTLAFGAIIGALCADGMIALSMIGAEYYTLIVVLGMTAFIGATSRIPVTACVFAIEALGGIGNILAIILATTTALLTVELSGVEDFTETVIHSKIRSIKKGKQPTIVEAPLTVTRDCFVEGKEMRDILWPNACVIVSFDRAPINRGKTVISEGDVITVHYKTYHPKDTAEELIALVGEQAAEIEHILIPAAEESVQ